MHGLTSDQLYIIIAAIASGFVTITKAVDLWLDRIKEKHKEDLEENQDEKLERALKIIEKVREDQISSPIDGMTRQEIEHVIAAAAVLRMENEWLREKQEPGVVTVIHHPAGAKASIAPTHVSKPVEEDHLL